MQKVVLVTGGSRGIGAATCLLLAEQGYRVCVNYRQNRDAAERVVSQIKALGSEAAAYAADVSQETQVIDLFNFVDQTFGPVTHLVNNAGILLPQSRLVDMDAARIRHLLNTNVVSYFLCCKQAVRRMHQGGAIVNVSSTAARLGAPGEYIDYAASKGAIDTLTRGLAAEVAAQNIRVNAVRPGIIDTQIHADGGEPDRLAQLAPSIPMQRGGTALEVAHAIAWLLSDQADYITGTAIDISGGR